MRPSTPRRGGRDRLLPFDSFGLMLSFRCDARCQFCAYNAGKHWNDWIELDLARDVLVGVKELWEREGIDGMRPNTIWYERRAHNKREGIHVTGGEPFLDFERTLAMVRLICELGLHLQFVQTNGLWVESEEVARDKYEQLKEAGATGIYFSRTPFHAEFVPNRNLRIGIEVGEEVFGEGNVAVREASFMDLIAAVGPEDEPVPLHRYIEHYGLDEFRRQVMQAYGLTLHGRAAKTVEFIFPRVPMEELLEQHCRRELLDSRHAHLRPSGDYIPFSCTGFSFGKLGRDVAGFFDDFDIRRFPVVQALCTEGGGLRALVELGRDHGFLPRHTGYPHKCVLCLHVREHLKAVASRDFPELGPDAFYEMRAERPHPGVRDVVRRLGRSVGGAGRLEVYQ